MFKAWTEPDRFATWFGEHGSSIPLDTVSMDVRPGGAWSATMLHGPERVELVFSGHYREVVEPERLVLTVTDAPHSEGPDVEVVTVALEDLGGGKTQMTFTQRGGNLPPDEYSRAMRGWLIFFDRQAQHLFETGLPPRYYLPLSDVRMDLLRPSESRTYCPYKGEATYWSLEIDGTTFDDFVWTYRSPLAESQKVAGLASFYNEKINLYVDGELQGRPKTKFS